jgi:hypothetical protein
VLVVRHHRGTVWLDGVGASWDGHRCFADDGYGVGLRASLRALGGARVVGLVTHALTWNDLEYCWILCSDGAEIRQSSRSVLERLVPGQLVVVRVRDRAVFAVVPDPSVPESREQSVVCPSCAGRVVVTGLPSRAGQSRIVRVTCPRCRTRVPLEEPIGGLLSVGLAVAA